jgi:hypothetical protein
MVVVRAPSRGDADRDVHPGRIRSRLPGLGEVSAALFCVSLEATYNSPYA